MKTLTDITSYTDYVEELNALFESDEIDDVEDEEISYPPYSKDKFLDEVYMDGDSYDALVGLVLNKKNVILQGAPGVGKTYAAKTNSKGIATVKVKLNKKKTYKFTAKFRGDDTFKSVVAKGKVVVK